MSLLTLRVFVFKNGQHVVFLPYVERGQALAEVAARIIRIYCLDPDSRRLVVDADVGTLIHVDSLNDAGFTRNGAAYIYGHICSMADLDQLRSEK